MSPSLTVTHHLDPESQPKQPPSKMTNRLWTTVPYPIPLTDTITMAFNIKNKRRKSRIRSEHNEEDTEPINNKFRKHSHRSSIPYSLPKLPLKLEQYLSGSDAGYHTPLSHNSFEMEHTPRKPIIAPLEDDMLQKQTSDLHSVSSSDHSFAQHMKF